MSANFITFLIKELKVQDGRRLARVQSVIDWKESSFELDAGDFPAQPLSRVVEYFTVSYPLTWEGMSRINAEVFQMEFEVEYPVFRFNGEARISL